MSRAVSSRGAGTSRSRASDAPAAPSAGSRSRKSEGYFRRSELPLTSLAFVAPLVVLYEVGTRLFLYDSVSQLEQRIIAFDRMQKFFFALGATGRYMPAFAVVGLLLSWHIARRDRWKIRARDVLGMAIESLVLAVPLIVMGQAAERYLSHITLHGVSGGSRDSISGLLVLSLGAGVYEELVFRLICFTVLNFLLIDVLKMGRGWGIPLIVLSSAVLFSAYHYLGAEPFRWSVFSFRTLAGLYFGTLFLCRGFGVTAGCHAAYDVSVVLLHSLG